MFEAYLIPIEDAAIIFMLLAILLLIPLCVLHYRRFGYVRPLSAAIFYSFLLYCLCAVCLVTLPLPERTASLCAGRLTGSHIQLVPFEFIVDILTVNAVSFRHLNLISILENGVFLQAAFNVLLLLPLGLYLRYYFRTRFKVMLGVALATTLAFEITQLTGIYGIYPCPYRTFDVDDLILNSTGAVLGYGLAPLFWFLPDIHQRPYSPPTTVNVPRRMVAFVIDWFLANTVSRFLYTLLFQVLLAQASLPQASLSQTPRLVPVSRLFTGHALWFDIVVYTVWFILIPSFWQGKTVGKQWVKIRMTSLSGKVPTVSMLFVRYALLIFLPIMTEVGLISLGWYQLSALGMNSAEDRPAFLLLRLLGFLGLLVLEVGFIVGFVLLRHDHRGLHDVLSKTQHVLSEAARADE